jgi:hypothetical protein
MTDLQAITDRFEIEALRGEITGAVMQHDEIRYLDSTPLAGSAPPDQQVSALLSRLSPAREWSLLARIHESAGLAVPQQE